MTSVIELENMASPTFAGHMRRLQLAVLNGFNEMPPEEAMRAIYFATVYHGNFEAVALDSDGFCDNEFDTFDHEQWRETIEIATEKLSTTFGAIAVPLYFPKALSVYNDMPCHNIIMMIGVERFHFDKVAMGLYQRDDRLICNGEWYPASMRTVVDSMIVPVRRAVAHQG